MGRGRLKMELIANERARKTTFQKRRKGMMKKAYEFSTLCELDMCMIMYGPKLTDRPPELHTWPENRNDVNRIIDKYKASTMRKPAKKTFDLSDLLTDRKTKVHVDIYRARKEMYEAKYPTWYEHIDNFSENELENLVNGLDARLESGKRALLSKRSQSADYMEKVALPNNMFLLGQGGNPSNNNFIGELPSNLKQAPCSYYMQQERDQEEEDKKLMSSNLSSSMLNMLHPFPVSFDNHHHHRLHPSDHQMASFENPDQHQYLNTGPSAMLMLMESKYNYSTLQFSSGSASSSNNSHHHGNFTNHELPVFHQYPTLENMNMTSMMLNSNTMNIPPPHSSSSMSQYYARLVQQPTVPYMPYPLMPPQPSISSHQVHHQENKDNNEEYDDVINQYLVVNNIKMA